MDSITQIVLGAATGELVAGKKLGNKAMLYGAIGGTIPDLDVLWPFGDEVAQFMFHRGPMHSFLFAFIAAPLLGYLLYHLYKDRTAATFKDWTLLFLISIGTHPILDCFTLYGTNIMWPFSLERVAWSTVFVADPLYTLPFMALVIAALFFNRNRPIRRYLNNTGLIISSLYLAFTVYNKLQVNEVIDNSLADQEIASQRYISAPTPFNNILWYAMVETDSSYYMGYYSLLDEQPYMKVHPLAMDHNLPKEIAAIDNIALIKFFAKDYYTVKKTGEDTYELYDLRFGTMNGLEPNEDPQYVFTFKIDATDPTNIMVRPTRPDENFEGDLAELMKDRLSMIWERMLGI